MKRIFSASALVATMLVIASTAGPAVAAISPPEAAATVWNCETNNAPLTVTGAVGDTFTIQNTSSGATCGLLQMDGIVTASSAGISPQSTVTFTIVGPGLFLVSQGIAGLVGVTIVVADPQPEPEPDASKALPDTGSPTPESLALAGAVGLVLIGAGIWLNTRRRRSNV